LTRRAGALNAPPRRSAVIIAAYRAERWIGECLASWEAVRVPDGWTLDLRIGVDGCPGTAKELDRLGVTYRYSAKNVGPYLIRNALIEEARADCYTIFDADDRVLPVHQELLLPLAGRNNVSAGGRYEIDANGNRINPRPLRHSNGVCVISHGAWTKVGGFRPWRIAADADMHARLPLLGVHKRKTPTPVFERRSHPHSLTRAPGTRHQSPARRQAKAWIAKHSRKTAYTIVPECASFEPAP
jgi:glycosyltransferase involved in cell wall biosynthesis